jgi:hypothetical protein
VETAKHRIFEFLDSRILPEHKLVVVGSDDALVLGLLSSRIHVMWALGQGALLEDRPVYPKTQCFDPFPFPVCGEGAKERIRALAEELDAHRKRAQAQHGLTLTSLYNVLEKLRAGQLLSAKEKEIHDKGLVSVLRQLHDDLDAAVFEAYGWGQLWKWHEEAQHGTLHDFETGEGAQLDATPDGLHTAIAEFERELDQEILRRLVALNAERAAEEKRGIIRWLRPEYQNPQGSEAPSLDLKEGGKPAQGDKAKAKAKIPSAKIPWPKPLGERIRATEQALHTAGRAVDAAEVTKQLARAKEKEVQEILETLVTLGRARRSGEKFSA